MSELPITNVNFSGADFASPPLDSSVLCQIVAGGETLDVEFKSDTTQISDNDIVKAVACLANRNSTAPGWLLLGVNDDGTIGGVHHRHNGGTNPQKLKAMIEAQTTPSAEVSIWCPVLDEKRVIAIRVLPSSRPVGTSRGMFVRRTLDANGKPACVPMRHDQMYSQVAAAGNLDFSAGVADGVAFSDLDLLEIERLRTLVRETPNRGDQSLLDLDDEGLCRAIGATERHSGETHVRNLGLLLFGRRDMIRELIPTHRVAFQIISQWGVHTNEIDCWPLLRVMSILEDMIVRTHHEDQIIIGARRIGLPEFHPDSVREAVANALMHRDYFSTDMVQVRWLDSHFEVASPGAFPNKVSLDNCLVTSSVARNPLLVSAFKRAGIVEQAAQGIRKIFNGQLRKGRPVPAYQPNAIETVQLTVPRRRANLSIVRLVDREIKQARDLNLDDLLIVHGLVGHTQVTLAQAMKFTQRTPEQVQAILDNLVERDILARNSTSGNGVTENWQLSATVQRIFSESSSSGRASSDGLQETSDDLSDDVTFTDLRREALILKFVKLHGGISRGDVVEICHIPPKAATRTLTKLVRDDKLVRHGSRRGTWYGLPEQ